MKRILALSGGGVRGVVEIAFLEAVEEVYRARRGPQTRLSDVFDLVGGTSTGALIAAGIALGKPVAELRDFYLDRARRFFVERRWWQFGVAPLFDSAKLEGEIRRVVGDTRLGDPAIRTRLAIVMKRLDTGSPWIVTNIPTAPFHEDAADGSYIGNRRYELALVLRASSAAPTYFQQQLLRIADGTPEGVFVDGGASPYNDPSLALLKIARLGVFGLRWQTGPDALSILSIGTGRFRRRVDPRSAARMGPFRVAVQALTSLVGDGEKHSLEMMEWLGRSPAPSPIDAEVGDYGGEYLAGAPLFRYARLDIPLEPAGLRALGVELDDAMLARFLRIDDPGIIEPLYQTTRRICRERMDLEALLA